MDDAPHTASPLQHLRAARATATFATAYASQVDEEFMTNIKKAGITQRDVKNEGTSGDMYENKGVHDTMPDNSSAFLAKKCKSTR
jgi:hypothetical protein